MDDGSQRGWERLQEEGELQLNSPIETMRFTLVYEGPLSSQPADTGSRDRPDRRAEEKHSIRRQLHRQLRDLWQSRTYLQRDLAQWLSIPRMDRLRWQQERQDRHEANLVCGFQMGAFMFVPLVTKYHFLLCDLDILFLRAEPAGTLFTSKGAGDLDNRLKVLFDALRRPERPVELPPAAAPSDTEDPFFCLLEDDRLVTSVRLESEQLFDTAAVAQNHVKLIIRVTLKTEHLSLTNLRILGSG